MSSLLERIARRRRASAGRRLGPSAAPSRGAAEASRNGHPRVGGSGSTTAPATTAGGPATPAGAPAAARPVPRVESIAADALAAGPVFASRSPAAPEPSALPTYESWLPTPELLTPFPAPPASRSPAAPSRAETAVEPEAPADLPSKAPVGPEPVEPTAPVEPEVAPTARRPGARPGLLERGRMRRRARYLRRLRELQLRDLGGFVLEAHRYGRERPDIIQGKAQSAAEIDRELRGLERALDGRVPLRELREPGIGGACPHCGTVHGSMDRFCSHCGRPLATKPPNPDDPAQ